MYKIHYPIRFFDVSMREGSHIMSKKYTLTEKQIILKNIVERYKPESIDIGKFYSSKLGDDIKLYKYAQLIGGSNYYMSVAPSEVLLNHANNKNIRNISLNASVSNAFQCITQHKNIDTTYENIENCLTNHHNFERIKLNFSCINWCPVSNKRINNSAIIREISRYCKFKTIKEFCLVDTCGTLEYYDFQSIIDDILEEMGPSRLSLRLYIREGNVQEVNRIISAAMYRGIYKFDVSGLQFVTNKHDIINIKHPRNIRYEDVIRNCLPHLKDNSTNI